MPIHTVTYIHSTICTAVLIEDEFSLPFNHPSIISPLPTKLTMYALNIDAPERQILL
jgi:hypothetical protein